MAANRPHVPKFGNWEAANNTPYTVVFDKARKGRTDGRMINPNDPQENPDMFPNYGPPPPQAAPPPRTRNEPEERVGAGRGAARPTHERRYSKEDGRASGESPQQQQGGRGANSGRTTRPSAGSVHSIEKSPLHPQNQPKLGGRGNGSPALGGKNSYDGTPGRTSGRTGSRGDETPNRGTVLPKFGDWDESNPASAENFTQVFNKAREDKNDDGRSAGVPIGPSSHAVRRQKYEDDMKTVKCCCFVW